MKKESIVLAGGAFWATEAVFRQIEGIITVRPGYSGGKTLNPTFRDVGLGNTGHAEVVLIEYNTGIISLDDILDIFWEVHNPTTLNKQGHDRGAQYRSAIFYTDDQQHKIVKNSIAELEQSGRLPSKVVTEVKPLESFYPAESEHENYFELNADDPYCKTVIAPKIKKLNLKLSKS